MKIIKSHQHDKELTETKPTDNISQRWKMSRTGKEHTHWSSFIRFSLSLSLRKIIPHTTLSGGLSLFGVMAVESHH